jgi:hypothetical protein
MEGDEHFIEHQAKREDVAARVDFLARALRLQLFRRHVIKRAHDLILAGERHGESGVAGRPGRLPDARRPELRKAEVQ